MIIAGDSDHFIGSLAEYPALALALNARLVVLPHCGAAPQEEQPEQVARLIRSFFSIENVVR